MIAIAWRMKNCIDTGWNDVVAKLMYQPRNEEHNEDFEIFEENSWRRNMSAKKFACAANIIYREVSS